MSKSPLFSTYRQGENRVTSSMLAVFEGIDLSLLETLLGAASGEASLQMVTFTNQPPGQGHSVPDGCISARFAYWFEAKTTRNAIRADQLVEHLHILEKGAASERLFVVTPDPAQPAAVDEVADTGSCGFPSRPCTTRSTPNCATSPATCQSRRGSCYASSRHCSPRTACSTPTTSS